MKRSFRTLLAATTFLATLAQANAGNGNFALNGGLINFTAPSEWPVIMQMSEGNPQVIAFQVKDPADTGTGEASRVSVTTRKIDDAQAFQQFVNTSLEKARQTPGYEHQTKSDSNTLRYTGLNAKTKYAYRENYFYKNGVAVQLRCVHPLLKETTSAWLNAFEQGCDQIATSLQK
ncbi:hypothetical protein [Tahibacter amnicola]|uniref:PsbP protein n=1 Tax=Tahibacter amnicola TaxID=2976241 RepID=A0ABY6BAA4_9GAMM|nr:hypothetical protein [Tahibacter amnicola]UXI66993.1 hypothetical protein N4264_19895 [Tahibacter amnicola]